MKVDSSRGLRSRFGFLLLSTFLLTSPIQAQISFISAIDLALSNSPKVKLAEADVQKSTAILQQSRDVFIPAFTAGSGLGYSYGFPVGQPTLYNFNLQFTMLDFAQNVTARANRLALQSANRTLSDVRQQVAQDSASTYIALDFDLRRLAVVREQARYAKLLNEKVQARLDAKQDISINLTKAQLLAAQINLAIAHLTSDIDFQLSHLSNLTGLPFDTLSPIHESIPALPASQKHLAVQNTGAIEAAYLNADSKAHLAVAEMLRLYLPHVGFVLQYDRYASFNNYQDYYQPGSFKYNNFTLGLQANLPIFSPQMKWKIRESHADANHALYNADLMKFESAENQIKSQNSLAELNIKGEIASLELELAQQQLDVIQIQLENSSGEDGSLPANPKDGQNAHIQERQKFLDTLEAEQQLQEAQLALLRASGQLEVWLKTVH